LSPPFTKATYGVGCTKLFKESDGGWYIDDDYNKKTLTDAITNALSRLGFGADVRMGEFDGSKYNDGVTDEQCEIATAWIEYIKHRRDVEDYADDITDNKIMSSAIDFLQKNTRRVTPETIRDMMK